MYKLYVLLGIVALVAADIPVHCVKHQIKGQWNMKMTKPALKGHGQLSCGHRQPDNADQSYRAGFDDFVESQQVTLNLNDDYTVDDGKKTMGSWTMVYDEGFEVLYNNVKYFAFSKYEPQGGGYKSLCSETLVGWYNNLSSGERGCYRAEKADGKKQVTDSLEQISVLQPEFLQTSTMKSNKLKLDKYSTDHEEVVKRLNDVKKSWKAKVYPQFVGKNMLELNQMAGMKRFNQQKQKTSRASFAQIKHSDTSDLPRTFSYEEYLERPRQQKQCGSCYAIATMAMLSSRLRMQGESVTLAPQYSLDCNYYNQGCDGGYPYLVEKFAQESFLVTEDQYPYKAENGNCKKIDFSKESKVFSVKNYRYIGGGYGLANEREIMLELYHNGPVVLNFEPNQDFMYYESGIYHSVAESDWSVKPEWEKVDHSVLCYGWGEENGQKYWMLQNSWGDSWGENGNFRMKRGADESAIESMAEAADPVVLSKSGSGFIELQNYVLTIN